MFIIYIFYTYVLLCDASIVLGEKELAFHLKNFNVFTIKSATEHMRLITTTTTIYRIMENIFSVLFKA